MSIFQILKDIDADTARNHKLRVITEHRDNQLFRRVLTLALDPYINFYIRKIPQYTPVETGTPMSLEWALDQLSMLSGRQVTGHAGIAHLQNVLNSLSFDDATVVERIIGKDLRCGAGDGTVNAVIDGHIPTFDVMLSHKDISGIKYPAIAQCKMDGARCHLRFNGNVATAYSRSGREFQLLNALDNSAKKCMKSGETWDGELVFFKDGKPLDRKTSNGLANKASKGTISQAEADMVIFTVWDIVDFAGTIPYTERFDNLINRISSSKNRFHLVDWKIVNNENEAMNYYEEMIAAGQEGCIVKNRIAAWEPKRTKNLGKVKAEEEADLVVVGWNEGSGKYEGFMGSLICETSDGLLQVNVSGWTDDDRKTLTPENTFGKILAVKYNAIIDSKGRTQKSLFLPRAVEFRFDKNVANKLSELM